MFNGRACPLNIPGTIVLTGNRQDGAGHAQSRQDGNVFDPAPDSEGRDGEGTIARHKFHKDHQADG